MTLRCVLFGHRRSRSLATYDERRGRWISQCKRCHVMLERDDRAGWQPFVLAPGNLKRIELEQTRPSQEEASRETAPGEQPGAPFSDGPVIGSADRAAPATHAEDKVEVF